MEFYRWNEQSAVKPEVKIEEGSNKYEEDKKDGIFQVVAAPEMGEANRSTRSLAICEDRICAVTDNGKLLELSYARNRNMQISQKNVTDDNYVGCFYSPIIRRVVDITHGVPVVMICGNCIAVYNPQSSKSTVLQHSLCAKWERSSSRSPVFHPYSFIYILWNS